MINLIEAYNKYFSHLVFLFLTWDMYTSPKLAMLSLFKVNNSRIWKTSLTEAAVYICSKK